MPPTSLAIAALEIARGEIGVREDPPNSNRGPRVDQYLRRSGLDPAADSYSWCGAFLWWTLSEAMLRAGGPFRIAGSASVHRWLALNPGLVIAEPEAPCVFLHFTDAVHGHCGFVTEVGQFSFRSIEGNSDKSGSRTGGQVIEQVRERAYAHHFLRIA